MDKQQRYEELRGHFNEALTNGGEISDAEHAERVRLYYEIHGIQPPDLNAPLSITSSNAKDGGLTIYPSRKVP